MRRHLTMLLAVWCLLTAFSLPAYAAEYTIDVPSAGEFGVPTSDETIYAWENPNVDRSKNSALIPPGFGTPTSYLPGSGEYLTPNLAAGGPLHGGSVLAGGGAVAAPGVGSYPTTSAPAAAFTDVADDLYYSDGSLGTLKIPAIELTVKIYEGTDSKALARGTGHFPSTSIWDGNTAFAAHNRGVNAYFGKIHTLDLGDTIILKTRLGTCTYAVTDVMKVDETDRSMLAPTSGNCITLFTCVRDQREYRWCIRAVEVK